MKIFESWYFVEIRRHLFENIKAKTFDEWSTLQTLILTILNIFEIKLHVFGVFETAKYC